MQNTETSNLQLPVGSAWTRRLSRTWINGKIASYISVQDRGLAYGDGLFTTVAVENHKPILWGYHKKRCQDGLNRLGIFLSKQQWQSIELAIQDVCQTDANVFKLILTRGASEGYKPSQESQSHWILYSKSYRSVVLSSIALDIHPQHLADIPLLAGLKHLNRLEQVMLEQSYQGQADDFIVCDAKGNMIETSKANLVFIHDETMVLPSHGTAGICGVMRFALMRAWINMGGSIEVRHVHLSELENFKHVFITNALKRMVAVHKIKEHTFSRYSEEHTLKKKLEALL